MAVFLLAAVLAFAVAGYAVAHWWEPVIWRGRENRVERRGVIVVVAIAPAPSADSIAEAKESA